MTQQCYHELPVWVKTNGNDTAAFLEPYSRLLKSNGIVTPCSAMIQPKFETTSGAWITVPSNIELTTAPAFLPQDAIDRAAKGNPIEKAKLAKDGTSAFVDVYEYAAKFRSGEMTWEEVEAADMNTRLKFVGMLHRDKRTPGQFMMRLKVPNGIVNADQMRFYADCVEKYGEEKGVVDITTRQNIQMRGVKIEDAPDIIDGLHARNQTSFQSALDSVRNMVGSPLAGIDDQEMVDTREFCNALNDLLNAPII